MPSHPFISVVIASYNAAYTIKQCIESFCRQTYANKELIIIDGASVDSTCKIIKTFSNKITYWESSPDKGVYDAWNKALDHVKGDWICFIGADDFFWDDKVLENMAQILCRQDEEETRIVYGKVAILDSLGDIIRVDGVPWKEAKENIFKYMSIPHPGLMHHKSIFNLYGKFDDRFAISGDYELLLRYLKNGDAVFYPEIMVGMRTGGISTQKELFLKILIEEARARHKNNINFINIRWIKSVIYTILTPILGYKFLRIIRHVLRFRRAN